VQLAPGDADDAPARRLQAAVASAIGFEGVCVVVVGAAVELDDQPLGRPDAVDLDSLDEDVGVR
jgi:hypothetical protein